MPGAATSKGVPPMARSARIEAREPAPITGFRRFQRVFRNSKSKMRKMGRFREFSEVGVCVAKATPSPVPAAVGGELIHAFPATGKDAEGTRGL